MAFRVPPFYRLGQSFLHEPQASHWLSGPGLSCGALGSWVRRWEGDIPGPGPEATPLHPYSLRMFFLTV